MAVVVAAKQAKSEGESGPVETRLTRLTAMALQCLHVVKVSIGTANKVTHSCAVVAILSWCCYCLFSCLSIPM